MLITVLFSQSYICSLRTLTKGTKRLAVPERQSVIVTFIQL